MMPITTPKLQGVLHPDDLREERDVLGGGGEDGHVPQSQAERRHWRGRSGGLRGGGHSLQRRVSAGRVMRDAVVEDHGRCKR
jgi:hypothetical protein